MLWVHFMCFLNPAIDHQSEMTRGQWVNDFLKKLTEKTKIVNGRRFMRPN